MSHHRPNEGSVTHGDEEKAWDLKDDFKFAPKRPEDDPWKTLFDSLLEKENKRCDAWTSEIQNLLLFAGLFSGLVTAFILQSYKTLQPDPNADIVSLLSVIASGINNANNSIVPTTNPSNPLAHLALPSSTFSASSTAVRVNICWFISLILSLTVVLSGIIAMQWLREHQSFTGQLSSSRDMLAILNMRIEALDHWHVHEIITTFPVILAAALVLFFAGMIQFLHILGNGTLLVAVASVITVTLVLLSVSTVLPSAQCVVMYIWPLRQDPPPSPCPYKSPQSGIFHAICFYVSGFLVRRSKYFEVVGTGIRSLSKLNRENKHALMYLTDTWSKKTWAEIDLCWLSVRQACVLPELDGYHRFVNDHGLPPLLDISKTFRDIVDGIKVSPDVLAAAYHCFHDLATPFVPAHKNPRSQVAVKREELDKTFRMIVKRNEFLQSLLHPIPKAHRGHGSSINFGAVDMRAQFYTNVSILHHQNMFVFTDRLKNYYYTKEFFHHRVELGIRLGHALFSRAHHTKHTHNSSFPVYLKGELFDQHRWRILKNDVSVQVFHQYALMLMTFFDGAADPDLQISSECLLAHQDTAEFLEKAAWDMYRIVSEHGLARYSDVDKANIIRIFGRVLERISSIFTAMSADMQSDNVKEKWNVNGNGNRGRRPPANPVQLLYLAAMYVRRLNSFRVYHQPGRSMDPSAISALEETMAAMLLYKSRILDSNPDSSVQDQDQYPTTNRDMKHRLDGVDRFGNVDRFSEKWWTFLEGDHNTNCEEKETSLHGHGAGTTTAKASKSDSHPPRTKAIRPASMNVKAVAMRPSISVGTQGSLPRYTEANENYFFPQTESPTGGPGSSRTAAPSFRIEEKEMQKMQEQEGEGIPMMPMSTLRRFDGSRPDLSRSAPGSFRALEPNSQEGARYPNIRSLSFSFSNDTKTQDRVDDIEGVTRVPSSPSSSSSLQVRYPDATYDPNPNYVLSDDPYSIDTKK